MVLLLLSNAEEHFYCELIQSFVSQSLSRKRDAIERRRKQGIAPCR
jgi:hypothetical protein